MRFLVYHGHFQNKGAEAMLRTIVGQLRRRLGPDTSFEYFFEVPAGEYAAEEAAAGIPQAVLPRVPGISAAERIRLLTAMFRDGWAAGIGRWRVRCDYHRAFDLLRRFDGLLDASGLAYSDAFGSEPLRRAQWFWIAAAAQCKPVIFMPQSWGPFESFTRQDRWVLAQQLRRSALVLARDEESVRHLHQADVPRSAVALCPDMVFTFTAGSDQPASGGRERAAVAIAPNMRIYDRTTGRESDNLYVQTLVEAGLQIAKRGYALVLLPHEILRDSRRGRDDRYLCSLIREILQERGVAAEQPEVTTAPEIREVLLTCQTVVASRFHAAVLGLAAGLPVFLLGWQDKYAGLMRPFGMPECVAGIEDLEAGRRGQLLSAVDAWLSRREELGGQIRDRLPGIVRDVEQAFDQVAGILSLSSRSKGERS